MPQFLITTILLIAFLPNEYRHYSLLVVIIFWAVFKIVEKNKNNKKEK